jgi:uncharacterized membrane protein YgdD (TMEM256/DUF423 family)
MENLIATVLTFAAAVLSFLFGLIYLTRPKFMNYHSMAIQKNWEELVPEMQVLITALMRALSSGFLSIAVALSILQIQFNRIHEHWIALTILIIGSILALGSLYAMYLIRTKTKGRPPITIVLVIFIMMVLGYFFNIYS